jgi:hypothetical protein
MDPMMEEEDRRRRLQSAVVEPSPYTSAVTTVGRTRSRQHGPSDDSDDQVDGEAVMWTQW